MALSSNFITKILQVLVAMYKIEVGSWNNEAVGRWGFGRVRELLVVDEAETIEIFPLS